MGASTVLLASSQLGEKVKAVVADSPFASFDATFQQWLANKIGGRCSSCVWWYLRFWIAFLMKCFTSHDLSETDVVAAVKRSKAHIFHSHGTSDEVVPFANSRLLAKAAEERFELEYSFFKHTLGHTEAWQVDGYHAKMIEFLQRHLLPKEQQQQQIE